MVVLKIGLVPCGRPGSAAISPIRAATPRFAATFYGSLALLWLDRITSAAGRVAIRRLAALWIVAIAVSRVFIGVHTAPEVAVGLGVGLLSIAVFAATAAAGRSRAWPCR